MKNTPTAQQTVLNGMLFTVSWFTWFDAVQKAITALENNTVLTSPNGTRYKLVVSNAGTLSTVPA